MKLTTKEQQLLDSIIEGMDEPGCGWLHELNPFMNDRVCAGVLSALIQKDLVRSNLYQDRDCDDCYWIELVI